MFVEQTENRNWKYLFGPVASRRLGTSLGVDIIPSKTCTFDCVYCEVGKTTNRTIEIKPYVSPDAILSEVDRYLSGVESHPDFVTITGSGEPTLHTNLGRIIAGIKKMADRPVAVLTNSSLFDREAVRRSVIEADVVVPSLDSAIEHSFKAVNRPHPALSLPHIIDGLVEFRKRFRNRLWLEVLLVKGLNDSPADLDALRRAATRINPDRIQLNTVVRPPSVVGFAPLDPQELEACRKRLGERAEIIASFRQTTEPAGYGSPEENVVRMLRRRPCDLDEISAALCISRDRLKPVMESLVQARRIQRRIHRGISFFQAS